MFNSNGKTLQRPKLRAIMKPDINLIDKTFSVYMSESQRVEFVNECRCVYLTCV